MLASGLHTGAHKVDTGLTISKMIWSPLQSRNSNWSLVLATGFWVPIVGDGRMCMTASLQCLKLCAQAHVACH